MIDALAFALALDSRVQKALIPEFHLCPAPALPSPSVSPTIPRELAFFSCFYYQVPSQSVDPGWYPSNGTLTTDSAIGPLCRSDPVPVVAPVDPVGGAPVTCQASSPLVLTRWWLGGSFSSRRGTVHPH